MYANGLHVRATSLPTAAPVPCPETIGSKDWRKLHDEIVLSGRQKVVWASLPAASKARGPGTAVAIADLAP